MRVFKERLTKKPYPPRDAAAERRRNEILSACVQFEDRPEEAAERLRDGLIDTHPENRALAAASLGVWGVRDAASSIVRLLDARHANVRTVAAEALAKLRAPGVGDRLLEMAETDEEVLGRVAAMNALVDLALAGASADLDLVASLAPFLEDPDERVRGGAAVALGKLGDRRALEPLVRARRDAPRFARGPLRRAIRDLQRGPRRRRGWGAASSRGG